MAIKIKLKNSVTQDAIPTGSHLPEVGELAVNANINSIGGYMRASDNSIVKIFGPGSVSTPAASTTAAGIAELATSAETTTGTDTARVCTPAGVKAVTDAERTTSNSTYLALSGGTLAGVLQATAGSNSAPAIHFGATDSGLFGGTNTVSLTAGGTERLKADANGVGIGTSGTSGFPLSILSAGSTGNAIVLVGDATNEESKIFFRNNANNSNKAWIQNDGANLDLVGGFGGAVSFQINDTEKARVDSSGRLLVGLTSARTLNSGYTPPLQVEGNTATTSSISAINNINQTGGPSVWLGKSRAAALGGVTTVQSGDELGSIFFNGADGTDIQSIGASIVAKSNGTVAGNRMPGELLFATTADSAGSVSPTTRLTIGSDGTSTFTENLVIDNAKQIRFAEADSNGTNFVSLQAPDTLAADVSYTLPSAAPTANGQVLAGSTAGVLSWTDDPTGQWVTNGTNVYYDGGNVGIGAGNTPSEKLTVQGGKIQIEHTACDLLFMETGTTDTNHRIRQNFGNLYIQKLSDDKGTAVTGIVVDGAGHVELHHLGNKKVETTSTGATVSGLLTTTGNLRINGSPAWAETGGDYGNLSIRGTTASSSGFINLGNGAAATNSEFDLARIKIHNGATEVARITGITGDGNNDSGEIWFSTQASGGSLTTALVIDKDQKVGIGTTSPTTPDGSNADNPLNGTPVLSLYGDSPAINLVSSTETSDDWSLINFGRTGSTTNPYRAVIGYHQSADTLRINANNSIAFDAGGNINSSNERLRIISTGLILVNGDGVGGRIDATAGDSSIKISDGNGRSSIKVSDPGSGNSYEWELTTAGNFKAPNGKGIDFSAQTSTSASGAAVSGAGHENLTHYEEGQWTPAPDGTGQSYDWRTGRYTRIGNTVFYWFDVSWTGMTGSLTDGRIYGLPFASTAANTQGGYGAPSFRGTTGLESDIRIYGNSSYIANSYIQLQHFTSTGGIALTDFLASGRVTGEGFYYVNNAY